MAIKDDLNKRIRHPGWQAAAVLVLIAIVVTAALGGFRKAASRQSYPQYGISQTLHNGALSITPLRAWVARHKPGSPVYDFDKKQYLVLQLRVVNTTEASSKTYLSQDVVWLPPEHTPGAEGVESRIELASHDHSIGVDLHPRLPTDVDLVWELPPDRVLPARLTWGVLKRRFVEKAYLQGDAFWISDGPQAKLLLPVENRLAESGDTP